MDIDYCFFYTGNDGKVPGNSLNTLSFVDNLSYLDITPRSGWSSDFLFHVIHQIPFLGYIGNGFTFGKYKILKGRSYSLNEFCEEMATTSYSLDHYRWYAFRLYHRLENDMHSDSIL
ncbi:unnamed protein product [Schistosoma intercalatum]|nr:unnamed protein product [Schistosoma intercalatum]